MFNSVRHIKRIADEIQTRLINIRPKLGFNSVLIFLIVFFSFSFRATMVQAVHDFDLNVRVDSEDLSDEDKALNIRSSGNSAYVSSGSLGNKRSRTEAGTSLVNKCKKERMKYRDDTHPLKLIIDADMVDYLKAKEHELEANETQDCVWVNFNDLTKKVATDLCLGAWKLEVQEIPEINVQNDTIPDCDANLIPGPTFHREKYRNYKGFYQYLDDLENKEFFADLIRCNCAYLKLQPTGKKTVVRNSKKFFFLHRHADTMYFLTLLGDINSRKVKIVNAVNIRHIIVHNPE